MFKDSSALHIYQQATRKKKLPLGKNLKLEVPEELLASPFSLRHLRVFRALSHYGRLTGICCASIDSLCSMAEMNERSVRGALRELEKAQIVLTRRFRNWSECHSFFVISTQANLAVRTLQKEEAFEECDNIIEFFSIDCSKDTPYISRPQSMMKNKRKELIEEIKREKGAHNSHRCSPFEFRQEKDRSLPTSQVCSPFEFRQKPASLPLINTSPTEIKENSIRAHAREGKASASLPEGAASFFNSEMERDLAKRLNEDEVKKAMEIHSRLSPEELSKPANMIGWLIVSVQQGWGEKYLDRPSPQEARGIEEENKKLADKAERAVWKTRYERKNASSTLSAGRSSVEIGSGGADCITDFIPYTLPTSSFKLKLIEAMEKRKFLECPAIASIVNPSRGSVPDAMEKDSLIPKLVTNGLSSSTSSPSQEENQDAILAPCESRLSSLCLSLPPTRPPKRMLLWELPTQKSQTYPTWLSSSRMPLTDSFGKTTPKLSQLMQEKFIEKKKELNYG